MRKTIGLLYGAWLVAFGVAAIAGSTGCSSSPGSAFGFSPPQHRLTPEAQALRAASVDPSPIPKELAKALHPPFVVEPGDVLLVQPADLDTPIRFPADQPVLPDGTIDLGKYGRPVVAGKTVPAIEAEVQELVKAKEKDAAAVTVRLLNRQSKVYYVLGEVNAPGSFPVNGRETVLDAIIAAGGLTRRASERSIILSRPTPQDGCRVVLPVCYPEIVQLGDTSTNYQLQPGDRVYVASRGLMEDLHLTNAPKCPPCNRPQVPCPPGAVGCEAGPPAVLPPMLPR
jgi:protein involved in polysaccharide export with SLBB domain